MGAMSTVSGQSRIEQARARSRTFKTTVALGAALLFATSAALARSAHPGAAAGSGNSGSGALGTPDRLTAELQQGVFGAGSISAASGTPQAQTSTS